MNKNLKVSKSIKIYASAEDVWDALINPEKIKIYLFDTELITDWKVGSPIIFQGEFDGHKRYFDVENNEIKKLIGFMQNNKKMREIFSELIEFIRFPIMDTNFLIEYIKNTNLLDCHNPTILTSTQLLDIFANKHVK